jgi:hypothetical protein
MSNRRRIYNQFTSADIATLKEAEFVVRHNYPNRGRPTTTAYFEKNFDIVKTDDNDLYLTAQIRKQGSLYRIRIEPHWDSINVRTLATAFRIIETAVKATNARLILNP